MPILSAELVIDLRKHESLSEAEHALYLAFRRLKRRARRYFGRFEYLTFVEISQRGWPRLLLLARAGDVPRRWLSENWRECGGARITSVRTLGSLTELIDALQPYEFPARREAGRAPRLVWLTAPSYEDPLEEITYLSEHIPAPGETAATARRTRFSGAFFKDLLHDVAVAPEDMTYWFAYRAKFGARYAPSQYRWRVLFVEAIRLAREEATVGETKRH